MHFVPAEAIQLCLIKVSLKPEIKLADKSWVYVQESTDLLYSKMWRLFLCYTRPHGYSMATTRALNSHNTIFINTQIYKQFFFLWNIMNIYECHRTFVHIHSILMETWTKQYYIFIQQPIHTAINAWRLVRCEVDQVSTSPNKIL